MTVQPRTRPQITGKRVLLAVLALVVLYLAFSAFYNIGSSGDEFSPGTPTTQP